MRSESHRLRPGRVMAVVNSSPMSRVLSPEGRNDWKGDSKPMTFNQIRLPRFAIALAAAMLCFASVAEAGPPLICHTIEIGQAKSLPWISHNWNLSGGENYDTKSLVRDTLEILAPKTPFLLRMETLL